MSADRDARVAEIAQLMFEAPNMGSRDFILAAIPALSFLFVELTGALGREAEAKKDAERLATFASLLEQSARAKMEGMIEVIFAVMPPDGGSIGVSFGLDDQAEGSSALDALRNLLDSSRAVSLSEGGST